MSPVSTLAAALSDGTPVHFSAEKQLWNRKTNEIDLYGRAAVNQPGETLTADYIHLDMKTRVLEAKGNCVYVTPVSLIYGEEMHFNLDTRTGVILRGRVTNDQFTLKGERINKLGAGRFQTHKGEYLTCKDCAPSWSIFSQDMDMQVDGYAYLSGVTTKIKDVPILWVPYLIVPMKSRRQSGFLFPRLGFGGFYGFTVIAPYFWAINRSADMTFALGQYGNRGFRGEYEARYATTKRSTGRLSLFYLRDVRKPEDSTEPVIPKDRWALDIAQIQELPWNIDVKFRLSEVSDNLYPYLFSADIRGASEIFLPTSLSFSRSTSFLSAYLTFLRYRNLLNSNTYGQTDMSVRSRLQVTQLDDRTVQALPSFQLNMNDQSIGKTNLVTGATLGITNFTRFSSQFFDYDTTSVPFGTVVPAVAPPFNPGVDPIRKATRLSFTPTVYTTLRPFDVVSILPSLQYRGYFYNFGGEVRSLYRGYLLFQTELSTQLERIYHFSDDKLIPRAKHLIRPLLTYSYIPQVAIQEDSGHPFLQQITNSSSRGIFGYNFDDNDIVPLTSNFTSSNYFVPLGNSLAYGLTSQWIRRRELTPNTQYPVYQNAVEISAGQALNFLALGTTDSSGQPNTPYTRLFAFFNTNYDRFTTRVAYYYYPGIIPVRQNTLSTSMTYIMQRAIRQKFLQFDRSLTMSFTYNRFNPTAEAISGRADLSFSLNDFFLPVAYVGYDFLNMKAYIAGLNFLIQSGSQCWKLGIGFSFQAGNPNIYNGPLFDFTLNWTGGGFGAVTDVINTINPSK